MTGNMTAVSLAPIVCPAPPPVQTALINLPPKKSVDLIPCKFCPRRFRKAVRFVEHLEWVHGYKDKGCDWTESELGETNLADKNLPCQSCGHVFKCISSLIKHEMSAHVTNSKTRRSNKTALKTPTIRNAKTGKRQKMSSTSPTPSPETLSDESEEHNTQVLFTVDKSVSVPPVAVPIDDHVQTSLTVLPTTVAHTVTGQDQAALSDDLVNHTTVHCLPITSTVNGSVQPTGQGTVTRNTVVQDEEEPTPGTSHEGQVQLISMNNMGELLLMDMGVQRNQFVSEGLVSVIPAAFGPSHPLSYCSAADLPRVFEVALLLTHDQDLRLKLIDCGIQLGLDMSAALESFNSPPNVIVLPEEDNSTVGFAKLHELKPANQLQFLQ